MKSYEVIIFDLDGTLLDTLEDLACSANFALAEMGYPKRSLAQIRSFVGNGVAKLIERAVPDGTPPEKVLQTLDIFKKHYALHCEDHTAPYEGITELLDALLEKGKTLAVVSNKIDSAVSVLCKKYFGDRFAVSVGDREGVRKKPCPDSVFEVLSALGCKKENAIYIGDSEVDIRTAKNAEMDCISVTWGFRDKEILLREWGLKEGENDLKSTPNEGKRHGKSAVFFADAVFEVLQILS